MRRRGPLLLLDVIVSLVTFLTLWPLMLLDIGRGSENRDALDAMLETEEGRQALDVALHGRRVLNGRSEGGA